MRPACAAQPHFEKTGARTGVDVGADILRVEVMQRARDLRRAPGLADLDVRGEIRETGAALIGDRTGAGNLEHIGSSDGVNHRTTALVAVFDRERGRDAVAHVEGVAKHRNAGARSVRTDHVGLVRERGRVLDQVVERRGETRREARELDVRGVDVGHGTRTGGKKSPVNHCQAARA